MFIECATWAIGRIKSQSAQTIVVHWLGCQELADGLNCPYEPYNLLRDGKKRWQDSEKWQDEIHKKSVLYKLQNGDWAKHGSVAGDSGRRLNVRFLKSLATLLPSLRFQYLDSFRRDDLRDKLAKRGKYAPGSTSSSEEAMSSDEGDVEVSSVPEGGRPQRASAAAAPGVWASAYNASEKRAAAEGSGKGKGKAKAVVGDGGAASGSRKRPYSGSEGSP